MVIDKGSQILHAIITDEEDPDEADSCNRSDV
jgi:hypothetical protein